MGNLLGHRESFLWEDNTLDRNVFIANLNLGIVTARQFGDEVYGSPNFSDYSQAWGEFILFLYQTEFDSQERINRLPWINQIQYTTLVHLFDFFKRTTPNFSCNLYELSNEFPAENNGLIGCFYNEMPNYFVHDITTWHDFHQKFVAQFTFNERKLNFTYFKRFYNPKLTELINQIQTRIIQGQVNPLITGIHNPLIPNEQIHVHFRVKQNCALNIDGTWKHDVNNFTIPQDVCETLSQWGFLLPDSYYL